MDVISRSETEDESGDGGKTKEHDLLEQIQKAREGRQSFNNKVKQKETASE